MNTIPDEPSLRSIIWTDYTAFLALLFPLMAWALYLLLAGFSSPFDPAGETALAAQENLRLFYISVAVTVVGLPLLAWRVLMIRAVFSDGQQASGQIDSVYFYRDRGRVKYTYTFQGQTYTSGAALHRTSKTRDLQPGDQVNLVVDRNKPRRAFIREIYL